MIYVNDRFMADALDFDDNLDKLLAWESNADEDVIETVNNIIQQVKEGDAAVLALTNRYDRRQLSSIDECFVGQEQLQDALESITDEQREALMVVPNVYKLIMNITQKFVAIYRKLSAQY